MFGFCETQSTAILNKLEQVSYVLCQASWGDQPKVCWTARILALKKKSSVNRYWFQVPVKATLDMSPYMNMANIHVHYKSGFLHSLNIKKGRKFWESREGCCPYRIPNKPWALNCTCSEKIVYGLLHSYHCPLFKNFLVLPSQPHSSFSTWNHPFSF